MTINIGGVPEHFNFPFHYSIIEKAKSELGIELNWTDYPGGTGAMCTDLRAEEIDIAIVLTEGIIADISKGNKAKIVHWYVESPLVWGIHTSADSTINSEFDFANERYAISRHGSGSHLMAYVDADNRGLKISETDFVVIGNLNGAIQALTQHEADLFFWEKFTTKPYVDQGILKRVGECPTPWPCFAIAVNENLLNTNKDLINKFLELISRENASMKLIPNLVNMIATKYELKLEDTQIWLDAVKWKCDTSNIDLSLISNVISTLQKLNIVTADLKAEDVVWES